ncbi:MAG: hypothetical protein M1813_005211 [Trichoglossum hirsutum]|nr:MAG: hypothetical protein M1813_005211 [Trichoglossum hirsutum]
MIDDVPLGSLVPDKRYPHQDALSVAQLVEDDYSVRVDRNFRERMHTGSKSFFRTVIMRLVSASANIETHNYSQLSSVEGRTYELRRPKDVFRQLCTREDVQRWLEDGYIGRLEAYFIIGYRTFLDGKLVRQDHSSSSSARIQIPTGAGQTPVAGLGAEMVAELSHSAGGGGEYEMVGERIYAVCYRKVNFKLSKGVRGPFLEPGNRWRPFFKRSEDPGEATIIEAYIGDEDEDEGDCPSKKVATDGGGAFVRFSSDE